MEEISNMNFDHLSFATVMKKLSNWVLDDGINMGVKLIIGVLVIIIGFKVINNISKRFLKFAELKKTLLKKEIYLYSNIEFLIN